MVFNVYNEAEHQRSGAAFQWPADAPVGRPIGEDSHPWGKLATARIKKRDLSRRRWRLGQHFDKLAARNLRLDVEARHLRKSMKVVARR